MGEDLSGETSLSVAQLKASRRAARAGGVAALSDDELVAKYGPLVQSMSAALAGQLQVSIELDDLVSWGYQGLLEARERFDPAAEATFSSYAYYRIRGAMIDGLRRTGWGARGAAIKLRDALAVNRYMESQALTYEGAPEPETFAESVERVEQSIGDCVTICLLNTSQLNRVGRCVQPTQVREVEAQDLRDELSRAINLLSQDEREVLVGYYIQESSMAEIAQEMGISTSWVSRIHANAVSSMRIILERKGSAFCPKKRA